jgi:hypothetical protein
MKKEKGASYPLVLLHLHNQSTVKPVLRDHSGENAKVDSYTKFELQL